MFVRRREPICFASTGNVRETKRRISVLVTGLCVVIVLSHGLAFADSGKTLEVVVSSASSGKPVEGARVQVVGVPGQEKKTGKDGTARLEGLSTEIPRVAVAAPRFCAVRGRNRSDSLGERHAVGSDFEAR